MEDQANVEQTIEEKRKATFEQIKITLDDTTISSSTKVIKVNRLLAHLDQEIRSLFYSL